MKYENHDPILPREYGKVRVVTSFDVDEYGYEMLADDARFTSMRRSEYDTALYCRATDTVRLAKSDIWRDRRGRRLAVGSRTRRGLCLAVDRGAHHVVAGRHRHAVS